MYNFIKNWKKTKFLCFWNSDFIEREQIKNYFKIFSFFYIQQITFFYGRIINHADQYFKFFSSYTLTELFSQTKKKKKKKKKQLFDLI